jgi:hypothetical protein
VSEPKILTIERAKWRRGGDVNNKKYGMTMLLNSRGYMCCLGFDAIACGIAKDRLRRRDYPHQIRNAPAEYVATRTDGNWHSDAVSEAIEANDDPDISDREREKRVRAALKRLGWEDVRFV